MVLTPQDRQYKKGAVTKFDHQNLLKLHCLLFFKASYCSFSKYKNLLKYGNPVLEISCLLEVGEHGLLFTIAYQIRLSSGDRSFPLAGLSGDRI